MAPLRRFLASVSPRKRANLSHKGCYELDSYQKSPPRAIPTHHCLTTGFLLIGVGRPYLWRSSATLLGDVSHKKAGLLSLSPSRVHPRQHRLGLG